MRSLSTTTLGRFTDVGPLLLRLGVGSVFAVHGWQKLDAGPDQFAGMLDGLGVPAPQLMAWLTTVAEGIGGTLLILGVLTRLAVLPLIGVLVGAIALVKTDVGFIVADAPGGELDTALLAGLLCLLFVGPGRFSVDAALGVEAPLGVTEDPVGADQSRAAKSSA